ncbi:MAG: S-formylglutathione hydrolase [Gammaproteobacteria bacterium]|nr:S-formylglutathione hydrolase [Gammaproteobacteria bacterium]
MIIQCSASHQCSDGQVGFYRHDSECCAATMRFAVFVPAHQPGMRLPVLYYLSGLTCNEEVFMIKAGAQRFAAEHGIVLVAPDTSPRDTGIEGATEEWDFGEGAGFYVDATESPWSENFRMYSYVRDELRSLIARHFPVDPERQSIFGHSMGGHGALVLALRNPQRYRSVSAFAPIVAPSEVAWGHKALPRYLGEDRTAWRQYDACALVAAQTFPGEILIDQGLADDFLEPQLQPQRFVQACHAAGQQLCLRQHPHYDHGYYFIQSFIADHLQHHAEALSAM